MQSAPDRREARVSQRGINPDNEYWQKTMLHLPDSPGIWRKTFEL